MNANTSYYPALDGVRALAITLVLALHGAQSFAPGGFLGVDLFFTLSGFLITRVLLEGYERNGKILLAAFWARRARRILPPVGVLLVLALVLWPGLPEPRPSFLRAAVPTLLYVANLQAIVDPVQMRPLIHTWSLSTEEQFYVLWPVLLVLLLRLRRKAILWTLVAIIVVAAASRAALVGTIFSNYYSPLARVDELLVGCALALIQPALLDRIRPFCHVAAIVFLSTWPALILGLSVDSPGLYAGGFTLFALGSATLLVVATDSRPSALQRALGHPWLVALGKRSYGVYLFHLPVFLWFEQFRVPNEELNFIVVSALRLGATLLVAEASYRLVERRFLSSPRSRSATLKAEVQAGTLSQPRA